MSIYIYSGPPSAATLPDGRDVILMPGRAIELPDDNAWVQTLAALGNLTKQPEPGKSAKSKPKESGDA